MEFLMGTFLALATGGFASTVGFDRSRSFYPVVLIVVASYYCLFAVMGGSSGALWAETMVAMLFAAAAVIGFRTNLWLIVAALAGHGAMDIVHHHLIANPGVPIWWPGFCSSFDITAAAYLALRILLVRRGRRIPPAGRGTGPLRYRRLFGQSGQLLFATAIMASFMVMSAAHAQDHRPSFHPETLKAPPADR